MPPRCTAYSECPSWFRLTAGTTDSAATYRVQCPPVTESQMARPDDGSPPMFGWSMNLMKTAEILILQNILPPGPYVVFSRCTGYQAFPVCLQCAHHHKTSKSLATARVLITTKVEEMNILDERIILFSGSLACINKFCFLLNASYSNSSRVFGAQDACIFLIKL